MLPYSFKATFGERVLEILILSQIARPGSLKLRDGIIYVNKKRHHEVISAILNTREYLEQVQERKYPIIEFLEFVPFYEWILGNDLLFPLNPTNSYQKALANLSYVFMEDNEISRFIYQMRILEQIYTDSINQISEQLDKRIQLFLGKIEEFKKQIKQMYDIRSRFLHGSLQLPPFHKQEEQFTNYEQSEFSKIDKASSLSLLLGLATLQKMYIENRLELKFTQILKQ